MIHICKHHNLVNYPPCLNVTDTGGTCAVVCSLLWAPGVSQYACMVNNGVLIAVVFDSSFVNSFLEKSLVKIKSRWSMHLYMGRIFAQDKMAIYKVRYTR